MSSLFNESSRLLLSSRVRAIIASVLQRSQHLILFRTLNLNTVALVFSHLHPLNELAIEGLFSQFFLS